MDDVPALINYKIEDDHSRQIDNFKAMLNHAKSSNSLLHKPNEDGDFEQL